ncbi:hypothetical protein J6590_093616 [Homalodisca vitripennis]|nr:hypothetical protein J6590_093616 [Homalodisca vitripennis]
MDETRQGGEGLKLSSNKSSVLRKQPTLSNFASKHWCPTAALPISVQHPTISQSLNVGQNGYEPSGNLWGNISVASASYTGKGFGFKKLISGVAKKSAGITNEFVKHWRSVYKQSGINRFKSGKLVNSECCNGDWEHDHDFHMFFYRRWEEQKQVIYPADYDQRLCLCTENAEVKRL